MSNPRRAVIENALQVGRLQMADTTVRGFWPGDSCRHFRWNQSAFGCPVQKMF